MKTPIWLNYPKKLRPFECFVLRLEQDSIRVTINYCGMLQAIHCQRSVHITWLCLKNLDKNQKNLVRKYWRVNIWLQNFNKILQCHSYFYSMSWVSVNESTTQTPPPFHCHSLAQQETRVERGFSCSLSKESSKQQPSTLRFFFY